MLTRLSTSALLFLCALSLAQFTAAAATVLAPGVSDQIFLNIWDPATKMFKELLPGLTLTEGASESRTFGVGAIPPVVFLEPGNPKEQSDKIQIFGDISGTITSDTESGPPHPGVNEGPLTIFSIFLDLAKDTVTAREGTKVLETFSLTEEIEQKSDSMTVNVPAISRKIAGDSVSINPFSFTFTSFNTEPEPEKEETFKQDVFKIVFQSDADVPEPVTPALVGSGLLLLGIIDRRRRKSSPRQRALTPSKTV